MPNPVAVGTRASKDFREIAALRFGTEEDFHILHGCFLQINSADVPDGSLGGFGGGGRSVDDLVKDIFLHQLLFNLFFYLFPPCLRSGREGEREKVEHDGKACAAEKKRASEDEGAHACGEESDRFAVAGEVGEDIESGEKNGYGEDGLG